MINNLGLTLTPDSMISFRDATWPMLLTSFLALAGNTFYPIFLRLAIWTVYKLTPSTVPQKEALRFLLDHPRRCYTLLFSSTATWTLTGILVALNFVDVLLIVTLDLDNPEVNALPVGPRILAAIFQAASSRHTGTASFNLANVNPAVQFSLMVMMYISIFPIAITNRMSSIYEDRTLGLFENDVEADEQAGGAQYVIHHMRNQLSFDLWYVFLGVFCICASESKRIMDTNDPVSIPSIHPPFPDVFPLHFPLHRRKHGLTPPTTGFLRLLRLLRGRIRVRQRRPLARIPHQCYVAQWPLHRVQQGRHMRYDDPRETQGSPVCA
jgi:Trk-type K+ transport system membrane component